MSFLPYACIPETKTERLNVWTISIGKKCKIGAVLKIKEVTSIFFPLSSFGYAFFHVWKKSVSTGRCCRHAMWLEPQSTRKLFSRLFLSHHVMLFFDFFFGVKFDPNFFIAIFWTIRDFLFLTKDLNSAHAYKLDQL